MAQDRVSGCDVEIEVREHEMVEVIVALHVALVGRAERERDLVIGRRIDLLGIERLQIGDRFCEALLELKAATATLTFSASKGGKIRVIAGWEDSKTVSVDADAFR
jgi:hypothetical protein